MPFRLSFFLRKDATRKEKAPCERRKDDITPCERTEKTKPSARKDEISERKDEKTPYERTPFETLILSSFRVVSFRMASFCLFAWRPSAAKRRKDEMAQSSQHRFQG